MNCKAKLGFLDSLIIHDSELFHNLQSKIFHRNLFCKFESICQKTGINYCNRLIGKGAVSAYRDCPFSVISSIPV